MDKMLMLSKNFCSCFFRRRCDIMAREVRNIEKEQDTGAPSADALYDKFCTSTGNSAELQR